VVAVVGQFHSSVAEAVQDLAEQLKVPVFMTQASAKKLTEKHLSYTFRTHVIDPDRVTLWNKWIQQQGFKRVVLLAENTDYGVGLVEETKKQFVSMNVKAELKTMIFDRAVVDLTPQILEIKNWKPDLFINIGIGTPCTSSASRPTTWGCFPGPRCSSRTTRPRARVLEHAGREGHLRHLHRLLPPDHEADPTRRSVRTRYLEQFKEQPVYGCAQRLCAGDAPGRRHERHQERQVGRHREIAPRQQVHGLERHHRLHARGRPLLAAVDAAHAFLQYTKPSRRSRGQDHLSAGLKTGDLMQAPKR